MIWPISYGELNVKSEKGYTLTNIVESLQSLWTAAIEKHLGISRKELQVSVTFDFVFLGHMAAEHDRFGLYVSRTFKSMNLKFAWF